MYAVTLYDTYARQTIAALAAAAGLAVFLYGALLLGAVAHTAGRTAAEKDAYAISAKVGALESTFLMKNKAINPELAASLGFVAPTEVATVYAGAGSLTLGIRTGSEVLR